MSEMIWKKFTQFCLVEIHTNKTAAVSKEEEIPSSPVTCQLPLPAG